MSLPILHPLILLTTLIPSLHLMRNPQMPIQITPHCKILPTTRDITNIRPLTRMGTLMHHIAGVPIETLGADFAGPHFRTGSLQGRLRVWSVAAADVVNVIAGARGRRLPADTKAIDKLDNKTVNGLHRRQNTHSRVSVRLYLRSSLLLLRLRSRALRRSGRCRLKLSRRLRRPTRRSRCHRPRGLESIHWRLRLRRVAQGRCCSRGRLRWLRRVLLWSLLLWIGRRLSCRWVACWFER